MLQQNKIVEMIGMNLDELINLHYDKLNENERYICRYFYKHRKEFVTSSIDEIAKKCGVSKSLLVRFSKHLGLSGFREFKAFARMDENQISSQRLNLMTTMTDSYHKMLDDFQKRDYTKIFDAIYHAKRVLTYGSGSSQTRVASEMKRIFLPHKLFINLHGHDMSQAIEKKVQQDDVIFLISLSGESDHMIDLAKNLRMKSAFLISVTRMSSNQLALYCNDSLYIESTHMKVGDYGDYESATPYFILIELLYIAYQNYLTERDEQSFKN